MLYNISMITFDPLTENHFALLFNWLNTGTVLNWFGYGKPISRDEIVEKYSDRIGNKTKNYIIFHDNVPVGFIKTYLINDYPEYSKYLALEGSPAAFDIFIADEFQNKGIGINAIKQFIKEVIFVDPKINSIIIGPAENNKHAINTYEKAGFVFLKSVKLPSEAEPEYLMELKRPQVNP